MDVEFGGPGGQSLEILVKLVRRLPIMLCPRWTASRTQPVALDDAVAALRFAIEAPDTAGRVAAYLDRHDEALRPAASGVRRAQMAAMKARSAAMSGKASEGRK